MLTGCSADDYQCIDYQSSGDFLRVEGKTLGRWDLGGGTVWPRLRTKIGRSRAQDLRRQAGLGDRALQSKLVWKSGHISASGRIRSATGEPKDYRSLCPGTKKLSKDALRCPALG